MNGKSLFMITATIIALIILLNVIAPKTQYAIHVTDPRDCKEMGQTAQQDAPPSTATVSAYLTWTCK